MVSSPSNISLSWFKLLVFTIQDLSYDAVNKYLVKESQ